MDSLPKIPTERVQKYLLKQVGITPNTWDREKAGVEVKRKERSLSGYFYSSSRTVDFVNIIRDGMSARGYTHGSTHSAHYKD